MGRYVTGNFKWKFAFGDQSSSFGEVLEDITNNTSDCYISRFIGTENQGEQVELYIANADELIKACKDFIGKDFKVKDIEKEGWTTGTLFEDKYWDKLMIRKFLKKVNLKEEEGEYLNFYVEY